MSDATEFLKAVLVAVVIALAVLLAGAVLGTEALDMEQHAQWMAEAKQQGAMVLW